MNIKLLYPGLRFKIIFENKIIVATIHKIYKQNKVYHQDNVYLVNNDEIWIKFLVNNNMVYTTCDPLWIEPKNIIGPTKLAVLFWYYLPNIFRIINPNSLAFKIPIETDSLT